MEAKEYKNRDSNYVIVRGGEYLSNLKKINIFVGANNSGKSRFLRNIFRSTSNDFVYCKDFNKELTDIYDSLKPEFGDLFYMKDLILLINSKTGDYVSRFNIFYNKIVRSQKRQGMGHVWDSDVADAIRAKMIEASIYKEIVNGFDFTSRHVYIPILRGLRHLDFQNDLDSKEDVYHKRTNIDYELKIEESENGEIFSGLSVYKEIKKMLLGTKENRKFIRDFEDFLSASFFQGKSVTLIPDYDTDVLSININGEEDRKIFDVGDGIQSIIINTFQAFKYQDKNLLLCIEEPEMTMHPSMQRILIETLTNKFSKLQVFLTTHSNHFLDLTYDYPNDITIYSFEESNNKFNIKNVTDNIQMLDLLGVRNSSVFLSNCVIWTEGVTDRMLIRKLLEFKGLDYKEDYHYSFAEYGGNNLENFDFTSKKMLEALNVSSISRTNYLIADNDKIKGKEKDERKNPKYVRRKNIEKILGKDSFFDKHIEIENLIPYKIWREVVRKILLEKPEKGIKLKDIRAEDEKKFNERLADEKIGVLFREYLIQSADEKAPNYFGLSSIQCLGEDKKKTMRYVVETISESDLKLKDFPKETRALIGSVIKFIELSNVR